ncbi:MAG: hypothetical protein F4X05_08530 [Rhodothermaceae bacterium]|nr:hypothetical protein [Rhodothermaceae bacterium]MYI44098.1 hypothetical protein [Rhodothermaceae bacterium]
MNHAARRVEATEREGFTAERKAVSSDQATSLGSVEAVEDFIPPSYGDEQELQALVAALESTSRESLPEMYRTMNRAEIRCVYRS